MGNLTKNLSTEEFACRCNYPDCHLKLVAHMPLVLAIQGAADHFADKHIARVKIVISGPNRCPKHNAAEGGAKESTHQDAIAADHHLEIAVGGRWVLIAPLELYKYYDSKYPNKYGIGLYDNRVHLDTREVRARWNNSQLTLPT